MTEILKKNGQNSWIVADGRCLPSDEVRVVFDDPGIFLGCTVFDSFVAFDGHVIGLKMHLDRLAKSAEAVGFECPDPETLRVELRQLVDRIPGAVRMRITLTAGGHRYVSGQAFVTKRIHKGVSAVSMPHPGLQGLPGWVKHGSRFGYVVARQREGVELLLWVDKDGFYLEGCTAGIVTEKEGAFYSAPQEGAILPSVTVLELARRAEQLGIPWNWQPPHAQQDWEAIYVASSGRDLAPVTRLNGDLTRGWGPMGRLIAKTWMGERGEPI